jgi:tetratricopeptide (TPR) repeat protein
VEVEAGSFVGRSNLAMSYGREAEGLAARGDAAGARACYERAAELAERAVAINPEFADARRRAATYGFAVGQDLRAVGHLEALIEMGERRPGVVKDLDEVRSWAAGAWAKLGEYRRAAGHYEVLARTSKTYGEFARRGLAEVRARMGEAAVEVGEDDSVR